MDMSTETENQGIEPEQNLNPEPQVQESTIDQPGESAPVIDQTSEGTPSGGINQEAVNKAINKKHFEMRKAQEEAERLAQKNRELEERLVSSSQSARPVIPPPPDPFDHQYNEKLTARDEAVRAQIDFDSKQRQHQQQVQNAQQQTESQKRQDVINSVKTFQQRAKASNINMDQLKTAEKTVATYITDPGVRRFLLDVEDGPAIVNYLAADPLELSKVADMSPIQAGVYLSTKVTAKAKQLAPTLPNSPNPLNLPSGKGSGNTGQYPLSQGATFE